MYDEVEVDGSFGLVVTKKYLGYPKVIIRRYIAFDMMDEREISIRCTDKEG